MSYFSKVKPANIFSRYLVVFIILEFLSAIAWKWPASSWLMLFMIGTVTLFLLFRNNIYFLLIPLAEIFWGSLGHSFNYSFLSTRLLIFILVVLVFLIKYIAHIRKIKILQDKTLLAVYLFLWFLILVDIAVGYYNTENIRQVFFDANAYLYLLYLPIWYQVYDKKYIKDIFDILKAATILIAVKTLLLLNIFSQAYKFLDTQSIYKWVRDTRTGEITPFKDSFFRIFMQSQFYLILSWFWLFMKQLRDFKNKYNFLLISLVSAALLVSLSRSFWLGAVIALVFILINIFVYQKKQISLHIFVILGSVAIAAVLLVQIFYNLPSYKNINIFNQRSIDTSEPALSARSQLWGPMWETILSRPIVGYGFGKEITYHSDDPTIKNIDNPEGWHTTYSFEWGWMDMLVKGGVLLLLSFVFWISLLYYRAYIILMDDPILSLTLLATLTSLLIIHIFTPYLNHPLGLAFLMLVSIFFSPYVKESHSYH